jgi:hypothetical protein
MVALLVAVLVVAGLTGCTRSTEGAAGDYVAPATVEDIPGSAVRRVVLTALAAQRLDIRTEPVAKAAGGPAVPVQAIVYDPTGRSWVYTNPAPLTYVRAAIAVDHVDGELAVLRTGPPVGTAIVTVGGQELLGTEYGVGEE